MHIIILLHLDERLEKAAHCQPTHSRPVPQAQGSRREGDYQKGQQQDKSASLFWAATAGRISQRSPRNLALNQRYPTKPEFREYQQEIVSTCICNNTLVCLPTGVGKTHIAAVIIANFSRWFPEQKIVFLAPTRPLVRQQVSTLKHLGDQVQKEKILEVNG